MQWLSQNAIWILLAVGFLFMARRGGMGCCGGHAHGGPHRPGQDQRTARDPVSGNPVDTRQALTSMHQGQRYWFESEATRAQFEQDPGKFAGAHSHRHGGCC